MSKALIFQRRVENHEKLFGRNLLVLLYYIK